MSRSAKVPVEIQVCSIMNENNRQQYLAIHTSLVAPNRSISLGTDAFRLAHMADQLESTFRTAISEEERHKAQQQGATKFYANVFRCYFAQCHLLFPCARVDIGLVE